MRKLKLLILLVAVILPQSLKRLVYNKVFGWDIDPTARIGLSFIQADNVKLAQNVRIGHFNTFRNLALLEVDDSASIGRSNHANALPKGNKKHFLEEHDRHPALKIGKSCGIVKGHAFDCCNTVEIGDFTILAGAGISFFTHSINITENKQETKPIKIGNYCMIGAHSVLTKGVVLPDYSILTANSTLHKIFKEEYSLYSGVPAVKVKDLDKESKYFSRTTGYVA